MDDSSIETIARSCHGALKEFQMGHGDFARTDWLGASAEQRASLIDAVRWHLANPAATAEAAHSRWRKARRAQGWRVDTDHPGRYDQNDRVNPAMVDWAVLPPPSRMRYVIVAALVAAMR